MSYTPPHLAAFYWAGWTAKSDFEFGDSAVWTIAIAAGALVFLILSAYGLFTFLGRQVARSESQ